MVTGDDVLDQIPGWLREGVDLSHMETGAPIATVADRLVVANAYLGAWPIADALAARNIPFVFTTGYQVTDTPPAYAAVPRLLKPIDPSDLARLLCMLR